jgi:hypothetical protein
MGVGVRAAGNTGSLGTENESNTTTKGSGAAGDTSTNTGLPPKVTSPEQSFGPSTRAARRVAAMGGVAPTVGADVNETSNSSVRTTFSTLSRVDGPHAVVDGDPKPVGEGVTESVTNPACARPAGASTRQRTTTLDFIRKAGAVGARLGGSRPVRRGAGRRRRTRERALR